MLPKHECTLDMTGNKQSIKQRNKERNKERNRDIKHQRIKHIKHKHGNMKQKKKKNAMPYQTPLMQRALFNEEPSIKSTESIN